MDKPSNKRTTIWESCFLKEDIGLFKAGCEINRLCVADIDNNDYLFQAFYIWKIFLNMASDREKRIYSLLPLIKRQKEDTQGRGNRKIYKVYADNIVTLEKYFESILTSYILSHAALEAYINFKLEGFKPTVEDYSQCDSLNRITSEGKINIPVQDIIRNSRLEDKIFNILPFYLKKRKIILSGLKKFQEKFKILNYIRNELVHAKIGPHRTGKKDNGKYWTSKLYNNLLPKFNRDNIGHKLIFNPVSSVFDLINFIEENCKNSQEKLY